MLTLMQCHKKHVDLIFDRGIYSVFTWEACKTRHNHECK